MDEAIKIVGVDEGKVTQNHSQRGIYAVPFRLSRKAPREWQRIFEREYAGAFHMRKFEGGVTEEAIIVHCPIDRMQEQLDFLKGIVETTNRQYAVHVEQELQRQNVIRLNMTRWKTRRKMRLAN